MDELLELAEFLKANGAKEDADALIDKIAADLPPEAYEKYYGKPMDRERYEKWLDSAEPGIRDIFKDDPEALERLDKLLETKRSGKPSGPLPEDAFPPQRPEDVLDPEDLPPGYRSSLLLGREHGFDYYEDAPDAATDSKASLESVLEKLSNMADKLDSMGLHKEADSVDAFICKTAEDVMKWKEEDKNSDQAKRYDSEFHHSKQIREPKREQELIDREGRKNHHVHTYQQTNTAALSTRYCPEHVGVSLARVAESTYQCSLDGKVYNWETGWTDYEGNKHPGGSVAGQTPDSTGYAIPHRIFDSRENILNAVN